MVSLSELARRRSLVVCFYRGAALVEEESDRAWAEQEDTEDVRLEGWREHEAELAVLGFDVVAISSQSAEAQAQCVLGRLPTSIMFLSDKDLSLAKDLELPTAMWPEGEWVYEPLTLLVEGGYISWAFYPLEHQRFDAAIATEWRGEGDIMCVTRKVRLFRRDRLGRFPVCVSRVIRSRWSAVSRSWGAALTPQRPVLGIADIADDLGMSRSTTHRYVITLVALGYLEQGASRKYRLGLPRDRPGHVGVELDRPARALPTPIWRSCASAPATPSTLSVLDGFGHPLHRSCPQLPSRAEQDRSRPCTPVRGCRRTAPSMGKLLMAYPPRAPSRRTYSRESSSPSAPQHDHLQESLARRARRGRRRRLCRQRRRARAGAALDLSTGAQRVARGRRRRQHGRARLHDLPRGARRRFRAALDCYRGSDLGASGI